MQQYTFYIFSKYKKFFQRNLFIKAGRNFKGRICVQHQGGADKHNYVLVDRFRNINLYGFVLRIIDDFFKTAFLGLILYTNGLINFILLSEGVLKDSIIFSGGLFENKAYIGSTRKLFNIKLFESINSVEIYPKSGAKLGRSAGSFVKIISKDRNKASLKMTSG